MKDASSDLDDLRRRADALRRPDARFTTELRVKLDGIEEGATANLPDATLLGRANHTGTQLASTISNFAEAVDDRVAALLVAGTNVTLTYNDVANTLTVAAAGGSGGPSGSVSIDFGPLPGGSYVEETVIDAAITASSRVHVWVSGTTADYNGVEHAIIAGRMGLSAVPASGQFTIHAATDLRLSGEVSLKWEAS